MGWTTGSSRSSCNAGAARLSQDERDHAGGARRRNARAAARLLVFDDISEIVSAQRAQAWGEVARRLAHEIKNPLTPIQLSAERLEMKLAGKLAAPEQALLTKSVKTIVDQVDAMKRLVNEFRDYARLPAAELKPVDLNALVERRAAAVRARRRRARSPRACRAGRALPADPGRRAAAAPGDPQPAAERAGRHRSPRGGAERAARSSSARSGRAGQRVRLVVQDSGTGFPEHILKRAFEPYVTTKAKGTGLGLAVVKKIADEHGARIDLANRIVDGAVARRASVVIIRRLRAAESRYTEIEAIRLSVARAMADSERSPAHNHIWQTYWWSTTNWASATCCRKS